MVLFKKSRLILVVIILLLIAFSLMTKRYFEEYTSDFIDYRIHSTVLSEERKFFVRLPEDYNKDLSYPVIIKSDGNFNLSRWDESLTLLSSQGNIEDSILVSIPNLFWEDSRNRDLVPPYARKDVQIDKRLPEDNNANIFGQADLFLAFIETEVLPFIENIYKVNNNRVLAGFSAGGSFVLYTIVTKPELFTGYFAFSPAAWYDDSVVVKDFTKRLPSIQGGSIFLYLSLGGEENEIITGSFKGLLSAIETSAPSHFYSEYSYSEGAGHVENPYISVPKALTEYYEFRKVHVKQ